MASRTEQAVEVEGKTLKLSNLDKVLYPKAGFTKRDVIDYYSRIAPVLLPHLKNRPLTLKRYPNGVDGMFFYEKRCPAHRPDWVKTHPIWSEGSGEYIDFCLAQDLPTLVWAANLADLELHTYLHEIPSGAKKRSRDGLVPTSLVFDLDPGAPANIVLCSQVALWIKELFDGLKLEAFPKSSGSKGLQLHVPLNTRVSYDDTKHFAHSVAQLLEREHPQEVVSLMKKSLRDGKVFVDWSQNDDHKTTVCVYSLRAKDQPTVSTPVTWDEVASCLKKKDPSVLSFTSDEVLARVKRHGDLYAPVLTRKQKLPLLV